MSKESACLTDSDDLIALETDHTGMNKFDSVDDANFIKIREAIRSLLQSIKEGDSRNCEYPRLLDVCGFAKADNAGYSKI